MQMPGVDDPVRVKELIGTPARLEIRPSLRAGRSSTPKEAEIALAGATDKQVLKSNEKRGDGTADEGFYIVEKSPVITGPTCAPRAAFSLREGSVTRSPSTSSATAQKSSENGPGITSATIWPSCSTTRSRAWPSSEIGLTTAGASKAISLSNRPKTSVLC